jgi:hypothetical protein
MDAPKNAVGIAVLALAEIKAAIEDFDRGDSNLFDALDRIKVAIASTIEASDSRQGAA